MQMGRAKLNMQLISKEKSRHTTFIKRKKGLKKKIFEFSTLCGVDACMIIYGPKQSDRPVEPETWPENQDEMHRIINQFRHHGKDDRRKRSLGLTDFFEVQKKKMEDELTKLRKKNNETNHSTWDDRINEMGEDQLKQLLVTLDSKIQKIDFKMEMMSADQMTLEGLGMIQYGHAPPNQSPCCLPNTFHGSMWKDTMPAMHTQPISYVKQLDHPMMPMNFPNNSSFMFDGSSKMSPMIPTNSYTSDNFSIGPMVNYPHAMKHPYFPDQRSYEDMGMINQGQSSYYMPPPIQSMGPSQQYVPCLMPGSSHQMHPFKHLNMDFSDHQKSRF
ncbi:hypothetical protein IFM89_002360 [Coptis chinensis]|uniref:MADS-box domain-containing protein n=1 Tax=Coptis chinensis TaxID=261450 RepID=A0A835IGS3_9MAGN|nr:hypothetical protein IFM89_002360 [Coptis chinensis]